MSLALFLWQFAALAIFGGTFFLRRAGPAPAALHGCTALVLRGWRWALLTALGAGMVVLLLEAQRILGRWPTPDDPALLRLLTHTRFGQVWCFKQLLLLMIGVRLLAMRAPTGEAHDLRFNTACFLVLGLYAGHGGTTEPVAINLLIHAIHVLAAASWAGALPVWWLVWRDPHRTDEVRAWKVTALRRFSPVALMAMLGLVGSGTAMSIRQFEAWPALFGTPVGGTLLAKLGLLLGVLILAAQLRTQWLPRLENLLIEGRTAPVRWRITLETLLGAAILLFGYALSRSTPGAHETVHWWLPFRLAPEAAWLDTRNHWPAVGAVISMLVALPAWRARWRVTASILALAGVAVLMWALAVPAWPGTYLRANVPYQATSIAAGRAQFGIHCAGCHGPGGRGAPGADALQADTVSRLPPDLSEHTALHTAGDMYWWLTHGMENTAMPGFASHMDEEMRWSVVNFLRAFADGFSGRVLSPTVAPRQPWLGAPDFLYETQQGENGRLRDFREVRPVLLVVASLPDSGARLKMLEHAWLEGALRGVQPFLVLRAGSCRTREIENLALPCIAIGSEAIVSTYDLLARTLGEPGLPSTLSLAPLHAEFLIDRYGFLRARWIPGQEEGWTSLDGLMHQLQVLVAEPRIRASPDEHVH